MFKDEVTSSILVVGSIPLLCNRPPAGRHAHGQSQVRADERAHETSGPSATRPREDHAHRGITRPWATRTEDRLRPLRPDRQAPEEREAGITIAIAHVEYETDKRHYAT